MPRLSSSATPWIRTWLPLIWITGFAVTSIVLQFSHTSSNGMKLAFPIVTLGGICFFALLAFPLKHVTLEGNHLLVEGRKSRALIPLSDVQSVSAWIAVNPEIVSIYLKRDSPFGRRIRFTPGYRILRVTEHPVVSILRDAAKNA